MALVLSLFGGCKVLGEAHAKFDTLVPPNLGEVVPHRTEAATVIASFPAKMLQCLRLGSPTLIRCHRWEEGTSVAFPVIHISLKLNFNAVCADLPV